MNGYCMVQITVHNADEYAKYAKALKFALAEGVSTRNYTIVEGV